MKHSRQKYVIIGLPTKSDLRSISELTLSGNISWIYLGANVQEYNFTRDTLVKIGTEIDISDKFHQLSHELRTPYLEYLHEISKENNKLLWWLTYVSCRNPSTSSAYRDICYIKLGLDLINNQRTEDFLIVISNNQIAHGIRLNCPNNATRTVNTLAKNTTNLLSRISFPTKLVVHRIIFCIRESVKICLARYIHRPRKMTTPPNTLLISYLTHSNISDESSFHRSFFGGLADFLVKSNHKLAVVPYISSNTRYKQALSSTSKSSIKIVIPHAYLKCFDIFSSIFKTFWITTNPKIYPNFLGLIVNSVISADVKSNQVRNSIPEALLIAALVRRLKRLNWDITRCIYIFENQPWERSLCWEMRRTYPDCELIGYQHARTSDMLLNFFLANGESDIAPLPDTIITVGEYTREKLIEGGHPPEKVLISGSLKSMMPKPTNESHHQPTPPESILIAASISLEEASELLDITADLAKSMPDSRFVLKFHPEMPYDTVNNNLRKFLPKNITISLNPIEELIAKTSLMIYSGSTVCFEAISHGVPVIHHRPRFDFDLDPLEDFPDVSLKSFTALDLQKQINWILEHRTEFINQQQSDWANAVSSMYSDVNTNPYQVFTI